MVTNDRKKKLLLVDDNDIQLSIAEAQLQKEYEVITACSGKEAIDYLTQGPVPDLIILDIMMPNMDGWETFGRLKAVSLLNEVPIVFLSAINEKSKIDRAYEMGAADYIVKPIEENNFNERIRKILEKQK